MERLKNSFLDELARELGDHPEKSAILTEYATHIDEILLESDGLIDEHSLMERIVSRLGRVDEIAQLWREELSFTPNNMKCFFILLNILFFGGGSLLTLAHNLYQWKWLSAVWCQLTSIPTLIAFLYMFFWALLGYEMGKGFGHSGKRILFKTFFISVIPNLLLMFLVIFEIIPHAWFEPLLTKPFIIACIIFTIILYPICLIGYRWGKKASI